MATGIDRLTNANQARHMDGTCDTRCPYCALLVDGPGYVNLDDGGYYDGTE